MERKGKKARIFTTTLTWNQNAELSYMRSIEENFHHEIDTIKNRQQRNHNALTRYHMLWSLRFDFHLNPPEGEMFPDQTSPSLSSEEQDKCDRLGIYYLREDDSYPSHDVAGIQIYGHLSFLMDQYKDLQWGLLEAAEGEFLVSDNYKNMAYIPIKPTLAFLANQPDQQISRQQVAQLNKISIDKANSFYFARQLSLCPIS